MNHRTKTTTTTTNAARITAMGAALMVLGGGGSVGPVPAHAATGVLQAQAMIMPSTLALTSPQNLNFGAFAVSGGAGSVAINTAGTGTYTGVTQVATPAPSEANIRIFGDVGSSVVISVTDPTVTVFSGANTMQVDNFQINTNAGGAIETVNMTNATLLVPIGATLNVNAGQAAGSYSGTFTVSVIYL
ncbi:DUF4402 domain-containing protein [Micavibrio aeruginosavorus]|uniref:DUF4402 domain-containing protein n=1 Tax=Micavibrio aeruginosavorus TaxID=349221 RepID=UPI003F4AE901